MSIRPSVTRTSDTHAPEMLVGAFGVVARSACRFKRTQRLFIINLVTVGHGQESTIDVLRKVGMVTIRLEHAKGTFIGSKDRRLRLFLEDGHLMLSAGISRNYKLLTL